MANFEKIDFFITYITKKSFATQKFMFLSVFFVVF